MQRVYRYKAAASSERDKRRAILSRSEQLHECCFLHDGRAWPVAVQSCVYQAIRQFCSLDSRCAFVQLNAQRQYQRLLLSSQVSDNVACCSSVARLVHLAMRTLGRKQLVAACSAVLFAQRFSCIAITVQMYI